MQKEALSLQTQSDEMGKYWMKIGNGDVIYFDEGFVNLAIGSLIGLGIISLVAMGLKAGGIGNDEGTFYRRYPAGDDWDPYNP